MGKQSLAPPAAGRIATMMAKVARAVAFAHERGVLHRDLKPSNILVDEKGEPQVTDFGLAKLVSEHDSALTLSAAMLGSPSYMAPEQADGRHHDVTTATDVYGLGAVLYELLAGRPPFLGTTPLATARAVLEEMPAPLVGVPRDLATVCLKCLAKEPAQRYATALALAEDLEHFARGEPVRARPVTTPEALWRWARRRPKIAALLGALLLAFVLGFAGVTWQWREAEAARQHTEEARQNTESARRGETSALARATATVIDLYTNTGLAAAKENDPTRAALWFARAATTPGADAASREASLARWAAWRGDSTTPMRAFPCESGTPEGFEWHPTQQAIIVSTRGGTASEAWDLKAEVRWRKEMPMRQAAWIGKGTRIVMADRHAVRVIEYPSGREIAQVSCREPRCLAVSADQRWVAVGGAAPLLWEPGTGRTAPLPVEAGEVLGLEFSRDGKRLLITGPRLRGVCALETPTTFLFPSVKWRGDSKSGFLGSGAKFITHAAGGQMLVLDSATGALLDTLPGRRGAQDREP